MNSTGSQHPSSGPFSLINENYNPQLFYLFTFFSISSFSISLVIIYLILEESLNFASSLIGIILFLILGIFFSGSAFTEYKARTDFITLTNSSIKYQHSPIFMHLSWLTTRREIKYSEIKSINVIQIKSGLDLLDSKLKQAQLNPEGFFKKQIMLEIILKNSEKVKIGERLSSTGVFQIAVLLEGRAQLGNLLAKIQEKLPNLSSFANETISKLKNLFKKS